MPLITVLLTVHNRREKTLECLRNLFHQELPSGHKITVFLTDDGCTDGTREAIANEFPAVNVVDGDGTLFWNRGMIAAWKEAAKISPDFYLWLNDDTYLMPGALSTLIECSERHQDKALIVGATCSTTDSTATTYGGRTKSGRLIPVSDTDYQCATLNGNIVLVPSCVYNRLGTNDPMFRHSLGDFDYGLRATKENIPIIQAPGHLGTCDLHDKMAKWCDPTQPLKARWHHFFSPTGANPFEFFRYKKRHAGYPMACATLCSNFLHVIFPKLWHK